MEPTKGSENAMLQFINSPEFKASPMSHMPNELVLHIFSNLGVDDLVSMRRVSQSFKESGEHILQIAAAQLKIPVQPNDTIKDINYFIKAHEKLSNLKDYAKISENGKSIIPTKKLTEEDRVKFGNSIKKLVEKYPDHPFSKGLKGVCSFVMAGAKYRDIAQFVNISQIAMANLPNGSWVQYSSPLTSTKTYVYKDNKGEVRSYGGRDAPPDFQLDPAKKLDYIAGPEL